MNGKKNDNEESKYENEEEAKTDFFSLKSVMLGMGSEQSLRKSTWDLYLLTRNGVEWNKYK